MSRSTNNPSRFYIIFSIMFLFASVLAWICHEAKPGYVHVPGIYYSQIFFLIVIPVGHWIAAKGLKDKARDFHIYYMGSMGIRFLLAMIYMFVIVYSYPDNAWAIIINFFLLYILYSSFEIYSLIGNLRAEK